MSRMACFRVESPEQGLTFMFDDVTVSMINVVGTSSNKRLIDIWYLDNLELGRDLKPKVPYAIVFDSLSFPFNYEIVKSAPVNGTSNTVHLVKYVGP